MVEPTELAPITRMLFSIQISILGIAVINIGTATFSSAWVFLGLLIVLLGVIVAGVVALTGFAASIDTV